MLPLIDAFRLLRRADRQRAGVPGEHWATFAAAYGTLRWAARVRSPLLRTAAYVAGGALVLRALGGRDGALARFGERRAAARPAAPRALPYVPQQRSAPAERVL